MKHTWSLNNNTRLSITKIQALNNSPLTFVAEPRLVFLEPLEPDALAEEECE